VRIASASWLPLQPERDTTTFIDLVSRPDIPPDQRPRWASCRGRSEKTDTGAIRAQ